jgi:xanthine dehydrogenase accessory factor
MHDLELYEEIVRLTRGGEPFALATVVETGGSSPRKPGAKMLVRSDGTTAGTVGGGRVEKETIDAAVQSLETRKTILLPFELTEGNGFVCGGRMSIYVEPRGAAPRLVMFGAGHVGRAVAELAKRCGFHVTVADSRPELANRENFPFADGIVAVPVGEVPTHVTIDSGTFIVIATATHVTDFEAVRNGLSTPARFIGLLGSARKKTALLKALEMEGFPPEARERVVSPVGLSIAAETPQEIAVSIVAELIRIRRENDAERFRDRSRSRTFEADGELQATPSA